MGRKRTILLYCPPPTLDRPSTRAPLALLAISCLLADKGFNIQVLPRHPREHSAYFKRYADDILCYGVSVMTGPQILHGLESTKMFKEVFPDIPVIWGGWHPTIFPQQTASHPLIDIAVRGQGERGFTQLVEAMDGSFSYEAVAGLTFKQDGKLIETADPPFEDVNRFPSLPYSLLRMDEYIFANELGSRTINYVSSRGCPYHCAYCAQNMVSGGKWYAFSSERMIKDIKLLKDSFGINGILLDDANFFVDGKRVENFADALIKSEMSVGWGMVNGRIEDLKAYENNLWALLKESGLISVFVGLEPLCGAMTRSVRNIYRELKEDVLKIAQVTGQYGIRLKLSLLVGFPPTGIYDWSLDEELEEAKKLLRSCYELSERVEGTISSYLPFPHAPLFDLSVKCGLNPPEDLEGWGNWVPEKQEMSWMPKGSIKVIEEINNSFRRKG